MDYYRSVICGQMSNGGTFTASYSFQGTLNVSGDIILSANTTFQKPIYLKEVTAIASVTGYGTLFAKANGKLYYRTDTGGETDLTVTAGGVMSNGGTFTANYSLQGTINVSGDIILSANTSFDKPVYLKEVTAIASVTGYGTLFAKNDGKIYFRTDTGGETNLCNAAGGQMSNGGTFTASYSFQGTIDFSSGVTFNKAFSCNSTITTNKLQATDSVVISGNLTVSSGAVYIGDSNAVDDIATSVGDSNSVIMTQKAIKSAISSLETWTPVTKTTQFDTTSTSTSTIKMNADLTGNIKAGYQIKYSYTGSGTLYGLVDSITTGLITIQGAAVVTAASSIATLSYATNRAVTKEIEITGAFADADDAALLKNDLNIASFEWEEDPAYLVKIRHICMIDDSGSAQAGVTVAQGGSNVLTAFDTVATTEQTSGVLVNTSNYGINYGDAIEIKVSAGGTNNDASDLFVQLTWVKP